MIPTYPMEIRLPIETTIDIRLATKEEIAEVFGEDIAEYHPTCTVLEGNGPGAFFAVGTDGKQYVW